MAARGPSTSPDIRALASFTSLLSLSAHLNDWHSQISALKIEMLAAAPEANTASLATNLNAAQQNLASKLMHIATCCQELKIAIRQHANSAPQKIIAANKCELLALLVAKQTNSLASNGLSTFKRVQKLN